MTSTEMGKKESDSEQPMIMNDEKKCPPELNTAKTSWEICKYAAWPILGMMFHPMYSIINAAVVGRMET